MEKKNRNTYDCDLGTEKRGGRKKEREAAMGFVERSERGRGCVLICSVGILHYLRRSGERKDRKGREDDDPR